MQIASCTCDVFWFFVRGGCWCWVDEGLAVTSKAVVTPHYTTHPLHLWKDFKRVVFWRLFVRSIWTLCCLKLWTADRDFLCVPLSVFTLKTSQWPALTFIDLKLVNPVGSFTTGRKIPLLYFNSRKTRLEFDLSTA